MDSKYSSFGAPSSTKIHRKRKHKFKNKANKKFKTDIAVPSTSNNNSKLLKENKKEATVNNGQSNKVPDHNRINLLTQRKQLPVYAVRGRLIAEIRKNDTMIILSETGSGKTTQIPQMIHEVQINAGGVIGVTQPRRVAAITVAMRVAMEMGTPVGDVVGYTVRFEDVSSKRTKLKYMTDGMLLREAMGDPLLRAYTVIVLDEAHERTVSTDVLFGVVKIAQKERKEKNMAPLKVIVMSATMDVDTFSAYFNNCPVIYLEGRTFPVTIFHSKYKLPDYEHAALCTIFQIHKDAPANHDILVFLTGQEEIETLAYSVRQIAKEAKGPQIMVCPFYAGLPPAKQLNAWRTTPPGCRKVVLATNIAETSITIPNIRFVIDTGVVKESTRRCSRRCLSWLQRRRPLYAVVQSTLDNDGCNVAETSGATKFTWTFSPATGCERLRVKSCCAAASWQRAGRAGRDAPGRAYRLFTAEDFKGRQAHATPEITRCPLTSTFLWMLAVGLEPNTFPLIDKPPEESIATALNTLQLLGAVVTPETPTLTLTGKRMSAFPIDPKFSKILLCAPDYGCLKEALSIVALLSSENIFHSAIHKRENALQAKTKYISELGDHMTLLNVFKGFCNASLKKQYCRENYLNFRSLAYAYEVRSQLSDLCQRFKLSESSCGASYDQLLKCLLTGLFTNVAWLRGASSKSAPSSGNGGGKYMTSVGVAASIHPSSTLHGQMTHACLLYTELLATQRTYMTNVSVIEADWLQAVAPEYARKCRMAH